MAGGLSLGLYHRHTLFSNFHCYFYCLCNFLHFHLLSSYILSVKSLPQHQFHQYSECLTVPEWLQKKILCLLEVSLKKADWKDFATTSEIKLIYFGICFEFNNNIHSYTSEKLNLWKMFIRIFLLWYLLCPSFALTTAWEASMTLRTPWSSLVFK